MLIPPDQPTYSPTTPKVAGVTKLASSIVRPPAPTGGMLGNVASAFAPQPPKPPTGMLGTVARAFAPKPASPMPSAPAPVQQGANPLPPLTASNPGIVPPNGVQGMGSLPVASAGLDTMRAAPPVPPVMGAAVSKINPANDLRSQAITPDQGVDRMKLVQDRMNAYDQTALPQFQANLRRTYQGNAAMGRLGSGMLRTDVGNLDLAAQNQRNSLFSNLLSDAAQGTIGDAANNRAELRGERGYQNELESQAFDRARQQRFDQEALLNSGFGRALQQAQFGYGQNPAGYYGDAARTASGNAQGAAQSFTDLLQQQGQQSGGSGGIDWGALAQQGIQGIIGQGAPGVSRTPTDVFSTIPRKPLPVTG